MTLEVVQQQACWNRLPWAPLCGTFGALIAEVVDRAATGATEECRDLVVGRNPAHDFASRTGTWPGHEPAGRRVVQREALLDLSGVESVLGWSDGKRRVVCSCYDAVATLDEWTAQISSVTH